jgi:hypothetical protein
MIKINYKGTVYHADIHEVGTLLATIGDVTIRVNANASRAGIIYKYFTIYKGLEPFRNANHWLKALGQAVILAEQ